VGHGTTFRIRLPLHERPPRLLGATKDENQTHERQDDTQANAADR
jgi:hypothetical protein